MHSNKCPFYPIFAHISGAYRKLSNYLINCVVIDVDIVVVVVVNIVVDVGNCIHCQQYKGHKIEGIKPEISTATWTS